MFYHSLKSLKVLALISLTASIIVTGCSKEASSSDASVGEQVDYKIVGIDPGAGLMKSTEKAITEYELTDWELVEGSGAAMTAALAKAYKDKEPIIVTGWTPHWMFAEFDLKYLQDPKGVYGGDEQIHTVARLGLKDDQPSAYTFLDKFEWTPDDMAKVMVAIQDGKNPEEAAAEWVTDNADTVDKWVEGITKVDGEKLKLAYVAWDSEIASTNIVKNVLEQHLGYKVEMLQVEAGPMWAGIANGDADAMVAAWLPTTHKDYNDKFKDKFEDLGTNLDGTKIGLVVPAYMTIDSIEDLENK